MNPLFELFNRNRQQSNPFGNIQNFMQSLQQLKQTGIDPNQKIQQMLDSGQITQEQYNQAVAKAQQLRQFFGN